ncbi:GT2 family glycosyltransferase [Bradyrhizobium sp. GM0.4]
MNSSSKPHLAILMACYNRRKVTLQALHSLSAAVEDSADFSVYLVDDGSTDGTAAAVKSAFPNVVIIPGSGKLYWNGAMRLAWQTALPSGPDFFLWLNDDVQLRPKSIADLIAVYRSSSPKSIVVGRTVDPESGEVTYGGYQRAPGWSRLRFRRLLPDEDECYTMNGNCVLLPARAVADVGISSARYRHAFGDNDYGLRAVRAGYKLIELKDPVALQEKNMRYVESVSELSLRNWRFIFCDPKGIPVREWLFFCREHGGPLWPINFIWRYTKLVKL